LFFSFLIKDNEALEGFTGDFGSTFSVAVASAGFVAGFQFFHCLKFRPGFSVASAGALFFTPPFATSTENKKL
jgi:hypothetical protein